MAQVKTKNEKKKVVNNKVKNVNKDATPEIPLVNENQEIIYDEKNELEKALNKMSHDDIDIELSDVANEAIEELKEVSKMTENIKTDTQDLAKEDIEKTIEKLNDIEKKLNDDITKRTAGLNATQKKALNNLSSKIDFTTFWSGISDGWN